MTLLMLLEMIASAFGDRLGIGTASDGLTYQQLHERAGAGAEVLRRGGHRHLAYLASSEPAFPVALFAAAWAGVPFLPLNYRLGQEQLRELLSRHEDVLVIADAANLALLDGLTTMSVEAWNAATAEPVEAAPRRRTARTSPCCSTRAAPPRPPRPSSCATGTSRPTSSRPWSSRGPTRTTPRWSACRRTTSPGWPTCCRTSTAAAGSSTSRPSPPMDGWPPCRARGSPTPWSCRPCWPASSSTSASPTARVPGLRSLAYGGARMPATVLERALRAFPTTDFVNAYGLTETSSTIAVLGPDDHRDALGGDEVARGRLASVGRLVPGIEVDVRDGEIWVRGEQVSGEYLGLGGSLDDEGWFPTRDRGWVDEDGYLFIEGRADDTIIRGGENIAPAEIEDVLLQHPGVARGRGGRHPRRRVGPAPGRRRRAPRPAPPSTPTSSGPSPASAFGPPRRRTSSPSATSCPTPTPASCCAAPSSPTSRSP